MPYTCRGCRSTSLVSVMRDILYNYPSMCVGLSYNNYILICLTTNRSGAKSVQDSLLDLTPLCKMESVPNIYNDSIVQPIYLNMWCCCSQSLQYPGIIIPSYLTIVCNTYIRTCTLTYSTIAIIVLRRSVSLFILVASWK